MSVERRISLELPASLACLNVLGACLGAVVERIDGVEEPAVVSYNLQLAADEVFANIVEHAYAGVSDATVSIVLSLVSEPRRLVVELFDTGASFSLAAVPAPNLDEAQERGYGLFLVHELMDEVVYTQGAGRNSWRLVKYL